MGHPLLLCWSRVEFGEAGGEGGHGEEGRAGTNACPRCCFPEEGKDLWHLTAQTPTGCCSQLPDVSDLQAAEPFVTSQRPSNGNLKGRWSRMDGRKRSLKEKENASIGKVHMILRTC